MERKSVARLPCPPLCSGIWKLFMILRKRRNGNRAKPSSPRPTSIFKDCGRRIKISWLPSSGVIRSGRLLWNLMPRSSPPKRKRPSSVIRGTQPISPSMFGGRSKRWFSTPSLGTGTSRPGMNSCGSSKRPWTGSPRGSESVSSCGYRRL